MALKITKAETRLLQKNQQVILENKGLDQVRPVLKIFTPDAQATWLIYSIDLDYPDRLYGLCDLGLGEPEIVSVSLSELQAIRGGLGLAVERDRYFTPTKTIWEYLKTAQANGRIDA